jgi:hypothetical protein
MDCQRCGREPASWLDTYRDEAVCEGCCPDREEPYGMQFVTILVRADAQRLAGDDGHGSGRDGGRR